MRRQIHEQLGQPAGRGRPRACALRDSDGTAASSTSLSSSPAACRRCDLFAQRALDADASCRRCRRLIPNRRWRFICISSTRAERRCITSAHHSKLLAAVVAAASMVVGRRRRPQQPTAAAAATVEHRARWLDGGDPGTPPRMAVPDLLALIDRSRNPGRGADDCARCCGTT